MWQRGNIVANSLILIVSQSGPAESMEFVPNKSNDLQLYFSIIISKPALTSVTRWQKNNKTGLI